MREVLSERGFQFVNHEVYPPTIDVEGGRVQTRLVSQSSAMGPDDAPPGATFL